MKHEFVVINAISGRSMEISGNSMNEVQELVRSAITELEKDGKYCVIQTRGGIIDDRN